MSFYFRRAIAILIIYIIAVIAHDGDDSKNPIIHTDQGDIQGVYIMSRNQLLFSAFLGIPYAKPPIADLRLKAPLPADNWEGVLRADQNAPICVQQLPKEKDSAIIGQEDCLYLNVFTPYSARTLHKKIPVMVWIYGGAMIKGGATTENWGPEYLLDKDIVLVTFNYRLGLLGFMTMEDPVFPGNYGMKDQAMALKWVKTHIASYGGDKDSITIFGESAGAVSTAMHLISPLSKGLFDRVISQSGLATNFWSMSRPGTRREESLKFIKSVKCHNKGNNERKILECLQKLPTEKFLFSVGLTIWSVLSTLPFDVGIVREPEGTENPFLTADPHDEITKPMSIPWIIGVNSAEGRIVADPIYNSYSFAVNIIDVLNKNTFPRLLGYSNTVKHKDWNQLTEKIKDFYFQDKHIMKSYRAFVDMYTDRAFVQPALDAVKVYQGPCYLYYYDHVNTISNGENNKLDKYGAAHSDELYSLFYFALEAAQGVKGVDKLVSQQMIEYWTNFAYYGVPYVGNSRQIIKWDPVISKIDGDAEYLNIKDGKLEMKKGLRKEAYKLWNTLPIANEYCF